MDWSARRLAPTDSLVVAFDAPARTFRKERYEEYRAQRAPTPEDFPLQLNSIKALVDLLGVTRVEEPGPSVTPCPGGNRAGPRT